LPPTATLPDCPPASPPDHSTASAWVAIERWFGGDGAQKPSDKTTWLALGALVALWAIRFYMTWATWGDLTIDCGREMYVPTVLAQGSTLYRDIWYPYGPIAPYLNSFLFHLFGVRLSVLYWAGSLSALGSATFIFLCGRQLSSWIAGWTVGAVILFQAFQRFIFCFPLPYSFASVYGCLGACLFLWLAIRAIFSMNWRWMFGAATIAAVEFLLKLEFGTACYVALLLLIFMRYRRKNSWKSAILDLALAIPGIALCVAVIHWMICLRGYDFIIQQNIMSWPTSYFMKTYGKVFLATSGLSLDAAAWANAALETAVLAGVVLLLRRLSLRSSHSGFRTHVVIFLVVAILACIVIFQPSWAVVSLRWLFFPEAMLLYVAAAAMTAFLCLLRRPPNPNLAALALTLTFSAVLAFRILLAMKPSGYAIYYNAPALLSFLLLAPGLLDRTGRLKQSAAFERLLLCLATLAVVAQASMPTDKRPLARLVTPRGTLLVSKNKEITYSAAIAFMQEAASRGDSVLSLPEDTSLYFLSGARCPTRVYQFTPGVILPGRMTYEVIREIDAQPVHYLLWSNRRFTEYGAPSFGVDFDQTLGVYLRTHYRFVRPLIAGPRQWDWIASIWERKPEGKSP